MHTVYLGLDAAPDNCADWPLSTTPPTLKASWSEQSRGRRATFTLAGTYPGFFVGCVQGIWTSAPLQLRRTGKVATVALSWSAIQPDPHEQANDQTVFARFTDARGNWGGWIPYFSGLLTAPLDLGTTHTASVSITYRGPVPRRALRVQIKVEDRFFVPVTRLTQTAQIKA